MDTTDIDLQIELAGTEIERAKAQRAVVTLSARAEKVEQLNQVVNRTMLEVKAAELALANLQNPKTPPGALPAMLADADFAVQSLIQRYNIAVNKHNRLIHTPTEHDLALLNHDIKLAELDLEEASERVAAFKEKNRWSYVKLWDQVSMLKAIDKAKARLEKARTAYDRLRAGAHPDDIKAAKSNIELLKVMRVQAEAAKRALENPDKPHKGTEIQIELAKLEHAKALAAQAEAKAALANAKAGVRKEEVTAANAAVAIAEKSLKKAQAQKSMSTLKAPFDGTVMARFCESGSTVAAFSPVVNIFDSAHIRVLKSTWTGQKTWRSANKWCSAERRFPTNKSSPEA